MRSQFEYYTEGIILRPFGGDPMIRVSVPGVL